MMVAPKRPIVPGRTYEVGYAVEDLLGMDMTIDELIDGGSAWQVQDESGEWHDVDKATFDQVRKTSPAGSVGVTFEVGPGDLTVDEEGWYVGR